MKKSLLEEDALLLIEQNFYFLHTGVFFSNLTKKVPLAKENELLISKKYGDKRYNFNISIIRLMLESDYELALEETTLFEFFVELNAFRGIGMAMVEVLKLDGDFKKFIEKKLGVFYEDFYDLISFVRNVLSHNIHADIELGKKDFEGTLKRIKRMKRKPLIRVDFNYHKDLQEIKSPFLEYGFNIEIDFSQLKESMPLLEVLSLWELMMLSELCFNFVVAYKLSRAY